MMAILGGLVAYLAPVFLILSPITSYADQILSIHRTRTSAGFSLDIPLIMLVASILKIFYWPGARYDFALLVQAIIMVLIQTLLLKVALDNRPSWRGDVAPFKSLDAGIGQGRGGPEDFGSNGGMSEGLGLGIRRPYNFWRWRQQRPYWEFVGGMVITLLALHTFLQPDGDSLYTQLIGYGGLAIEAFLPIPQILANERAKSCKGFRVSVLVNWLFGDAMKMGFFFLSEPGKVPWAFKMCGIFQACCDVGLGCQYWMYGEGEGGGGGMGDRARSRSRSRSRKRENGFGVAPRYEYEDKDGKI